MPDKPKASPVIAEDVKSPQAIINAYYSSISGAKGETRDWGRFLSLFMDDARFIVPRNVDDEMVPFALSPEKFVDTNHTYFERGGYYEQEIHHAEESFGHIAQVFSTYGSSRALSDPEPYARGINSFQLMKTNGRWWIVSLTWDAERSDINPIPAKYLPETDQED